MPERKISAIYADEISPSATIASGYGLGPKIASPTGASPWPTSRITSAAGRPRNTSMNTCAGSISQRVCDTAINASTMPATIPSTVENTDSTSVLTRPVHSNDGIDEISNGQSRKFCKKASMVRSLLSVGGGFSQRSAGDRTQSVTGLHRVRRQARGLRITRVELQVQLHPRAVRDQFVDAFVQCRLELGVALMHREAGGQIDCGDVELVRDIHLRILALQALYERF